MKLSCEAFKVLLGKTFNIDIPQDEDVDILVGQHTEECQSCSALFDAAFEAVGGNEMTPENLRNEIRLALTDPSEGPEN